jgi:hypothetical protein
MATLAKVVLGACVDKAQLRSDGHEYLVKNTDLAIDVITMLDGIRLLVQRQLKMNLLSERRSDEVTPPPEGEEVEEENNVSLQNTAISLLSEASSLGYERIRSTLCEELKIVKKCLPSYWMLPKDRPAIEAVVVLTNNAHTLRMVDRTYTAIQNLDEFVELQASNMMEHQTCQTVAADVFQLQLVHFLTNLLFCP